MKDNSSISYRKLRQTVGWLGILLPLIVYLDTIIFSDCHTLQHSISHYYYTVANSWFVGIFWGLGLVLFFYPPYKEEPGKDVFLTRFAGVCALLVSLFPTLNQEGADSCAIFSLCNSTFRAGVHYSSAAIMLSILAYMSICIFTKTHKGNDLKSPENKWKRRRNYIYVTAGWLTLISVVLIGILSIVENKCPEVHLIPTYTFWLEVAALLPFGISWLVKGGFIFTDDDEVSTLGSVKNIIVKKKERKR